jgi:hypothetical protein
MVKAVETVAKLALILEVQHLFERHELKQNIRLQSLQVD